MRIAQLTLAGRDVWPDLHVDRFDKLLNVFHAPPCSGKSTLAQLAGQVLYGSAEWDDGDGGPWRRPFRQPLPTAEGSLLVETPRGHFLLRQYCDGGRRGRRTISSLDNSIVDRQTVETLHANLPPQLLSRLYLVDFSELPRVDWLLDQLAAKDRLARQQWQRPQTEQPRSTVSAPAGPPRQASDILAQLTNGQLVQIRLEPSERQTPSSWTVVIVNRANRRLSLDALTEAQHDQLYLALTLALTSSHARRGIQLPLVLDEPFLRQDASGTAAMASVLRQFARDGQQLLVFTEDAYAVRCFRSLGEQPRSLKQLRRQKLSPAPEPHAVSPAGPTIRLAQSTEMATETATDDTVKPTINREATVRLANHGGDTFYLGESSSLEHFPVLGDSTATRFARLEIHTVGDLLAADAGKVARQLQRPDITAAVVAMWQSHMGLICFVPELSLADAQVLSAAGIVGPDDLAKIDADEFYAAVEQFLSSDRGRRFAKARGRYQRGCLSTWRCGAERHRRRWEQSRTRYSWPCVSSHQHPEAQSEDLEPQSEGAA